LDDRSIDGQPEAGRSGFESAERLPLSEIARAHELAEHPARRGRIVVTI